MKKHNKALFLAFGTFDGREKFVNYLKRYFNHFKVPQFL
jgi:hypothetical protein